MQFLENGQPLSIHLPLKPSKPTGNSLSKKAPKLDLATSLEKNWNSRFFVTYSKDNLNFHKSQREYFDTNRKFDKHYRDKYAERDAIARVVSYSKQGPFKKQNILKSIKTHKNLFKISHNIRMRDSLFYQENKTHRPKPEKKISILDPDELLK